MFINILPPKTQLKIHFRSSLRRYSFIWGIAGACALVCAGLQIVDLRRAYARLAELNLRCEPLYALKRAIQVNQQAAKKLRTESDALKRLQPTDRALDLLAILSAATRNEPGKLQIQRLTFQAPQSLGENKPAPKRGVAATAPAAESTTLNLQGIAEDDTSLARFVSGLRAVGVFDSVELKSSSQIAAAGRNMRQYQLECRYEDKP
jgi:Tfp pilus assembly protein PilN